jgi:tRNA (adenine-N(1)-)-methyltransferase non-catalytic subunit
MTATRREARVMREGDVVLVEINDGERATFVTLRAGKSVEIGKRKKVPAETFLGAPFGSRYEIAHNTGEVVRLGADFVDEDESAGAAPVEDERSNKHVSNKHEGAQTLTDGDIAALRTEFTGEEMVEIIAANSKTFDEKTAFAQEKYRARKMKKHMTRLLARFPSPRQVCEQLFYSNPHKTSYMRFDALSMLLNAGNVGACGETLVLDTCGGLVLGSVTHRMGGFGRICNGYVGHNPTGMEVLMNMNLEDRHFDCIRHASLSKLIACREKSKGASAEGEKEQAQAPEGEAASTEEKERKFMKIKYADAAETTRHARQGFTSVVIASLSVEPKSLLEQILPLCASSASFAIWFNAAQPLAEALHHLRNANIAIGLSLVEPFMRAQQVLPGRTHPVMTTDAGSGGWILSGTYVAPSEMPNKKPKTDD